MIRLSVAFVALIVAGLPNAAVAQYRGDLRPGGTGPVGPISGSNTVIKTRCSTAHFPYCENHKAYDCWYQLNNKCRKACNKTGASC